MKNNQIELPDLTNVPMCILLDDAELINACYLKREVKANPIQKVSKGGRIWVVSRKNKLIQIGTKVFIFFHRFSHARPSVKLSNTIPSRFDGLNVSFRI